MVVVSEERGTLALVTAGELTMDLDAPRLRERLREALARDSEPMPEGEDGMGELSESRSREASTSS